MRWRCRMAVSVRVPVLLAMVLAVHFLVEPAPDGSRLGGRRLNLGSCWLLVIRGQAVAGKQQGLRFVPYLPNEPLPECDLRHALQVHCYIWLGHLSVQGAAGPGGA